MAARRFLKNSEIRKRALERARQTGEDFVTAWQAVIAEWLAENPSRGRKKAEYPFTENGLPQGRHRLNGFETHRDRH